MKTRKILITVAVTLTTLALGALLYLRSGGTSEFGVADEAIAPPVAAVDEPAAEAQPKSEPEPVEAATTDAIDSAISPEVAATRRMYMAHAPLREPEVADPDSAQNLEILETMVMKALGRPSERE